MQAKTKTDTRPATQGKLTKKERRQIELSAHYARCETLAKAIGVVAPNGKKISVALMQAEHLAHNAATAYCNGEKIRLARPGRIPLDCDFRYNERAWDQAEAYIREGVEQVFEFKKLPGFFVNGDARGYALKIDNESPEGKALIDSCQMHTDWGGYGILSPEID